MTTRRRNPARLAIKGAASLRLAFGRDLRRDETGATAVEFGLLALPFFMLLGAVVELAAVFFMGAGLANAATDATRGFKTGQIQERASTPATQMELFRRVLCDGLPVVKNCQKKVTFVVRKANTTGAYNPNALNYDTPADDDPTLPDSSLDCSGSRDTVLVKVSLYHQLVLPGTFTRLSNDPSGLNRRLITYTTSFRNEPFGVNGGSNCGSAKQSVPS